MLKQYKLLLIDLDGTMYRGREKIEEAPLFIAALEEAGQAYMFLTNNTTKKPIDFARHLARFGIHVSEKRIYTSSIATATYIAEQKKEARVFVIGEEGLKHALQASGCQVYTEWEETSPCDYVVMGLDRQINYEKLAQAALAVRAGATFISTNPDKAIPSERGLLPGNGSLTAAVSTATQTEPLFIGKPEPFMIQQIMKEQDLSPEDLLMIGDNYETDILAGIHAGIDTALVFSGFTSREALAQVEQKPTYLWDTLLDWQKYIRLG